MSTRNEILMELGISPLWKRNIESPKTSEVEGPSINFDLANASTSALDAGVLFKSSAYKVLGDGDLKANWIFMAERPIPIGNSLKRVFVDDQGKLLDNMLAAMHLKRDKSVYLLDVLHTQSARNEDLVFKEELACDEFLKQQIKLIQPTVIMAMGSTVLKRLIRDADSSDYHQKVYDYHGINVVMTCDLSDLLQYSSTKVTAWRDLCFAIDLVQPSQKAELTSNRHGK